MKDKAAIIVLLIVAVGLGAGLVVVNQQRVKESKVSDEQIAGLSNTMTAVKSSLTDLQSVNQALETNLATTRTDYSNKLALSDANLRSMEANLDKAKAEAKAQEEANTAAVTQRDQKIASLESQNQDLDKEATELRGNIANLQTRIAGTEKELAQAKGDRTLLLSELKQLQAKKEDLEAMFNDLAVLRSRVKQLKAELALSRQLDWIRRGVYADFNVKGGERLIHPVAVLPPATNLALNAVIKQNGETKILAPPPTNSAGR